MHVRPRSERRRWRSLAAVLLAAVALPLTPVLALELEEARHLALRAGFGLDEKLMAQLQPLSRSQAVDKLVNAKAKQLAAPQCMADTTPSKSERRQWDIHRRQDQLTLEIRCTEELRRLYVEKMIASPAPLAERMTLFWHNHFTTSAVKVRSTALIYDQHNILAGQALGDFRAMLHSILNDPAMLAYLDNVSNTKDNPNENLARELLELFTLGEGRYTERDIKEAARALTGQSVDEEGYNARFYPQHHDFGEKQVLGETGYFGPEGLAELLLRQEQTAAFIARKVWLEFVSEEDKREVERLAQRFAEDWDIGALVRGVLLSDAFWEDEGQMIKSPVELLVGAARQLPGERFPLDSAPLLLQRLGQPLFAPPNVKGWPTGLDWVDSSRMMLRITFGERVVRGLAQETDDNDMAFLCDDGGPTRFAAALPEKKMTTSNSCTAQLASLLIDPVWQLK